MGVAIHGPLGNWAYSGSARSATAIDGIAPAPLGAVSEQLCGAFPAPAATTAGTRLRLRGKQPD
eukprot:3066509-Alexandrium_andersonii.AAC.1